MARGRLFTGTSGFAYKEWVGPFYPEKTSSGRMLRYYASVLGALEVNYTFRRHPAPSTLEGWRSETPEGFAFACKANQGITHYARLGGDTLGERLARFLASVAPLGDRLGPVLFQCPPTLRYDPVVLDDFLAALTGTGPGRRFAMEFRHPTFDGDEVRAKLAGAGVAWCVSDTDEAPGRMLRTGGFSYLRLRRAGYDAGALARWAGEIAEALDAGSDVFAFLKHEDSATGPRDALALAERVAAG